MPFGKGKLKGGWEIRTIEVKKSNLKYLWVDHEKVEYQGEDIVFATKNGETVCYKEV